MKNIIFSISILFLFSGCSAYFNQPSKQQDARFGEEVYESSYINELKPVIPIVVGVYKFRDQTGQYKQVDNGVSYSTAVTQGATTILIKALEDSKWFVPIERENVSNLLNERQIIRSTRNEDNKKNGKKQNVSLPPLLFAGVILEGGIISYDSNIITGGSGARYFGTGGSVQYRQDRISVYLRAVSTSNGKILKTVYISKTILSQAIDVNLFKFVKLKRLLEVETGVSQNEPGQLAVKEAIEKAVESLIIEGIKDNIWTTSGDKILVDSVIANYDKEKELDKNTQLFNRKIFKRRHKSAFNLGYFSTYFDGDYANSTYEFDGIQLGFKYFLKNPKFNISGRTSMFTLSNVPVFKERYFLSDLNFEYVFLPNDKLTPFVYLGAGGLYKDFYHYDFKMHYGAGIEYLLGKKHGVRLFAEKNDLFTDSIDTKISGTRNDSFFKFGVELNIYLGF
ncbi:MAG: CsgG/HfaB family protein [Flavobacteriaceae bacterium]